VTLLSLFALVLPAALVAPKATKREAQLAEQLEREIHVFASPVMLGGEILLGLSLAMFVAALIGVYGDRMLTNRRLSDLD